MAAGNIERRQQVWVPAHRVDVEQHGAAGVGGVGRVDELVGEVPDEPGVDGPAGEIAALGAPLAVGDVVQQPPYLGAGEVGVYGKAGPGADGILKSFGLEPLADWRGATALPNDGVGDRLSGPAVPYDEGLALVGYADGDDGPGMRLGHLQQLFGRLEARLEQLPRIVLDPSGSRMNLPNLAADCPEGSAGRVDQHCGCAGCALVEREDVARFCHGEYLDTPRQSHPSFEDIFNNTSQTLNPYYTRPG